MVSLLAANTGKWIRNFHRFVVLFLLAMYEFCYNIINIHFSYVSGGKHGENFLWSRWYKARTRYYHCMFMTSNWIYSDILPRKKLFNPFDSVFIILIAFFVWHFRLRVKLISCRWMKLATVIVSAYQMVHHQKYPVKSQTETRLGTIFWYCSK